MLVLDDDASVRVFLASVLAGVDVDVCESVADARERISSQRYDAWILDVMLPDGSGLELLASARAEGLTTPTLVLTGDGQLAHANRAQLLSATIAYKPDVASNVRAFVARVTGALSVADARRLDARAARAKLSRREREVLGQFAHGKSRAGVAEALGTGENTVKTIVRRLLAKTGFARVQDLVESWMWPGLSGEVTPPTEPVKSSGVRRRVSARASARPAAGSVPPAEPGDTLVPPARLARRASVPAGPAEKRGTKRGA